MRALMQRHSSLYRIWLGQGCWQQPCELSALGNLSTCPPCTSLILQVLPHKKERVLFAEQSCWDRSQPKASSVSKQQSWVFRWWAVPMLALGTFGTFAWRSQYIPQSKTQQFSGQIELMSWVTFVSFNVPVPIRRYVYVQQSEYYKKHSFLPYHVSRAWGKYYRNCMLCLL